MRITRLLPLLAVALAPMMAVAQTPPSIPGGQTTRQPAPAVDAVQQPEAASMSQGPWTGSVDFGIRGSDVEGDRGRYERYRDLGDGLFVEGVRLNRERNGVLLSFQAEHVGRRDQRYVAEVGKPGRFAGTFMWDQIPMLLSEDTRSLFSGIGTGVLTIDDGVQGAGQAQPTAITDIFKASSLAFVTRTRRHIADGAFEYLASEALTFQANFKRTDRSGTIPFGGSFGHSSLVELPAPTQHNLSEFEGGAEYARDAVLLRAGYSGSWFHNDVTSVIFDNPFRLTEIAATPSRGRLTLAPSNSQVGVNGLASLKLPRRSRVTAHASIATLEDAGEPLVPQTINTAISAAPLPRSTVEGEARVTSMNVSFVSRPFRPIDVTLRYRTYDFDNRTPEFTLSERVSYDNTPAALSPPIHAEQFSLERQVFDADIRWVPRGRMSAGIGFTFQGEDRSHRIFESTADHQLRLTWDTITRRWFSIRAKYEHAQRRGEGIERGIEELVSIGEQPGMRHFDIANRDRDRFTLIGSVTPTSYLTASLSVGAGKDDYLQSEFGLRDNTHRVYSAGADVVGSDRLSFGASYSFEEYEALSRSRQANPGAQFTDPSRNWASDTSDRTHSFILSTDVSRIAGKVDLRLSYDFNRSRGIYNYITGPVGDRTLPEEVVVPTTLPPPTQLPPTLTELNRGTVDLSYVLTSRVSVGVSYWHEQYRVRDFTLDIDANPDSVRGQALFLGYLYKPYTANTAWLRLLYRF